jgi:hypothetical protein
MAGTVTTTRILDKPFYFTRRAVHTGGLLRGDTFDVNKSYSSGWLPAVQQTTSFRSGRSFLRALADDPQQFVADEDLSDRELPDRSDLLFLRVTNDLKKAPDQTYDHGHPFSTTKVERTFTTVTFNSIDGKTSYHGPVSVFGSIGLNSSFDGGVYATGEPHIVPSSDWPGIDLNYGARAISKSIPTLPAAGMAAFLGELHEGLPRAIGHSLLFKERAHALRASGDEYLNYQFGWKPFVSDVRKFAHAFKNANQILQQYRKQSGKQQRRHYTFKILQDIKTFNPASMTPQGGINPPNAVIRFPTSNTVYGTFSSPEIDSMILFGQSASVHAHFLRTQKYRFTGAFSYLLSEDDSFFGRMERYSQLANKLLGVKMTPDVLWELTPWSWLADWEGNIGVNISNMTALGQDNLALRWGYLMRETRYKHYTSTSTIASYGGWSGSLHTTYRVTRKERVQSTPFGFGLNTGSFTDHQWSILAALGLTKAPKSLH